MASNRVTILGIEVRPKGINEADTALNKLANTGKEAERSLSTFQKTVGAFGTILGGAALKAAWNTFRDNTIQAEQDLGQLQAVLKSTQGAAGQSIESLSKMQRELADATTFTTSEISRAQTRLLSYSGIVGDTFPRALQAVADTSVRMGMSIEQAAESIGRAIDIPSLGLTALTRQGFRFTEQEKELVKQLEKVGKVSEAQGIILKAVESSYEGAARAARNTFGGALKALSNTINDLMTGKDGSLDGARESIEDLIKTLKDPQIQESITNFTSALTTLFTVAIKVGDAFVRTGQGLGLFFGELFNGSDDALIQLDGQIAKHRKLLKDAEDSLAKGTNWFGLKLSEKDEQYFRSQIATSTAFLEDAVKTRNELKKDFYKLPEVDLKDLFPPAVPKPTITSYGDLGKNLEKLQKEYVKISKSWKDALVVLQAEANGVKELTSFEQSRLTLVRQLDSGEIKLTASMKQSVLALADQVIALDKANTERKKLKESIESYLQPLKDEVRSLQQETANFNKSDVALAKNTRARLQSVLAMAQQATGNDAQIRMLEEEIRLYEELEGLYKLRDQQKAWKDSVDQMAADAKAAANTLSQSITDAIFRGFEDGKSFIDNFKSTLKNAFQTLVLRPTVEAIINPIANSIYGVGTTGQQSTGWLGDLLGIGKDAAGTWSGGFSLSNLPFGTAIGNFAGSGIAGLGTLLGEGAAGTFLKSVGAGIASGGSTGWLAGTAAAQIQGGATAAGAGTYFAAALPYVGLALSAVSLLSSVFGGGGTPHTGAVVGSSGGGTRTDYYNLDEVKDDYASWMIFGESDFFKRRNQGVADSLAPIADAFGTTLNQSFQALGGTGTLSALLGFSADNDSKSRGRIGIADEEGNALFYLAEKFAKDPETGLTQLTDQLGRAMRDALLNALPDLAEWQRTILEGIDDSLDADSVANIVQQISQIDQVAEHLGITVEQITGFVDQFDLTTVSEGFANAFNTLYQLDANAVWKEAINSIQKSFQDLGLELPRTENEFRYLLETLDLNTEAGRELALELVELAPAFLEVARTIETVRQSIATTVAEGIRDIELSLLDNEGQYNYLDNEIAGLISEIMQAQNPADVQELFQQAYERIIQSYNLLDETGRQTLGQEFIDRLRQLEDLTNTQLDFLLDNSENQQEANEEFSDASEVMYDSVINFNDSVNRFEEIIARIPELLNVSDPFSQARALKYQ